MRGVVRLLCGLGELVRALAELPKFAPARLDHVTSLLERAPTLVERAKIQIKRAQIQLDQATALLERAQPFESRSRYVSSCCPGIKLMKAVATGTTIFDESLLQAHINTRTQERTHHFKQQNATLVLAQAHTVFRHRYTNMHENRSSVTFVKAANRRKSDPCGSLDVSKHNAY